MGKIEQKWWKIVKKCARKSEKVYQNGGGVVGTVFIDPLRFVVNMVIFCSILKLVAALAEEAKLGTLFLNTQEAKVIYLILQALEHPQLSKAIHTNNTTTVGTFNNTIK